MSGNDNDDPLALRAEDAGYLEAVGHASAMARNDPDYHASLEDNEASRRRVANEVRAVTLVDRGPKGSHIEIDLARPRHRPAGMQTASLMSELFEAELRVDRQHAGIAPGDTPAGTRFAQPPQHTHYKDDRPGAGPGKRRT